MLTDEQVDALIISLCGEGVDLREGRAIFRAGMLEAARIADSIPMADSGDDWERGRARLDIATAIRQAAGEP